MIAFLRKIRQRLLAGNQFSKYLLYAIGEIALVVIGILIALAVNNWNEERVRERRELESLAFLKAEFDGNLQKLRINRDKHHSRLAAINDLLFSDLANRELPEIDSLYRLAFYSWTYNPSFSTYTSLVSSGKLNDFSNDSLKIRISAFRDLVADYQEDEENLWNHSRDQLFVQEVLNTGMLSENKFNLRPRTPAELRDDKSGYLEFFNDPESRNSLTLAVLHLKLINEEGDVLLKELQELLNGFEAHMRKIEK
ncbi:DUF6090 family protein [Robiginitalea sp. SC105]|uniref:DUF6090 family protein n=1 Tax=Robiginitalea sp. SC105 TaxID=2762332 RepID=UPI00163B1CB7|nr:DUF6090 family protein [Robiginitalea sp. SC105]MBC2839709.1 hypothetical protein [Robiginitalea sp. SC105]